MSDSVAYAGGVGVHMRATAPVTADEINLASAPAIKRKPGRPSKWDASVKDPVPPHAVCCGTDTPFRHDAGCIGNARDEKSEVAVGEQAGKVIDQLRRIPRAFGVECDPEVAWVFHDDARRFSLHRGTIPARFHAIRRGRVLSCNLTSETREAFEVVSFDAIPLLESIPGEA